jgi:hypothetical protein
MITTSLGVRTAAPRDPHPLPHCAYPGAADVHRHGVLPLPDALPFADFAAVERYRSVRHRATPLSELPVGHALETARVVADSFARREPQCRHVRPPAARPPALARATHEDAFGREAFGPWTTARHLYWFIRLLVLTDPTRPADSGETNAEALEQSLAIVSEAGRVVGGAINETLVAHAEPPVFRAGDPFLDALLRWVAPVLELLGTQDAEAVAALRRYPEFERALASGRVGHHFMIARSDALSKLDAFELFAATAERYRELGFAFLLVEATNQWTGAACEALNGVRVHFAPFRVRRVVAASPEPLPDEPTSPDGFIAGKDSGSVLYALRLA